MKRIYEGWLSKDESGDVYLAQNKPNCYSGIWHDMGENLQLGESDFPELTFENSPIKVKVTIERSEEDFKQEIEIGNNANAILSLPCVIGAAKGKNKELVFVVQDSNGYTSLARRGDWLIQHSDGEWEIKSKFKEGII